MYGAPSHQLILLASCARTHIPSILRTHASPNCLRASLILSTLIWLIESACKMHAVALRCSQAPTGVHSALRCTRTHVGRYLSASFRSGCQPCLRRCSTLVPGTFMPRPVLAFVHILAHFSLACFTAQEACDWPRNLKLLMRATPWKTISAPLTCRNGFPTLVRMQRTTHICLSAARENSRPVAIGTYTKHSCIQKIHDLYAQSLIHFKVFIASDQDYVFRNTESSPCFSSLF